MFISAKEVNTTYRAKTKPMAGEMCFINGNTMCRHSRPPVTVWNNDITASPTEPKYTSSSAMAFGSLLSMRYVSASCVK